jgi:hypothetical protein
MTKHLNFSLNLNNKSLNIVNLQCIWGLFTFIISYMKMRFINLILLMTQINSNNAIKTLLTKPPYFLIIIDAKI